MSLKKIIKQEQEKVLTELCHKIVSKKWSEKEADAIPVEIRELNLEELKEKIKAKQGELFALKNETDKKIVNYEIEQLEEKKKQYGAYTQHLADIKTNEKYIEADLFAYHELKNCEYEIQSIDKSIGA
jgi:ribosomal protein L29